MNLPLRPIWLGKRSFTCIVKEKKVIVSVSLAAISKYHTLGGLNKRHSFLTVLEAGKCEMRGQPGENSPRRQEAGPLTVSSHGVGGGEAGSPPNSGIFL